jgi:hypothetical protein
MGSTNSGGSGAGPAGVRGALSAQLLAAPRAARRAFSLGAVLCCMVLATLLLSSGAARAAVSLPDGRAWELVSPSEKHGSSVAPLGFGFQGPAGGLVESSEDGSALTFVATAPVSSDPEGNRSIEGNQVMSQRVPGAWQSKDIVTPNNKGEGIKSGEAQEYRAFSPSLATALVQPFGTAQLQEPPLTGASGEERSLYARHNFTCEASPATCFEALVTDENVTGSSGGEKTQFGGRLSFAGASADLDHAVFESEVPLTTFPAPEGGLYEWNAGLPVGEQLQLVGIKPGATKAAPGAELGNDSEAITRGVRNAVSEDGSRVFFNAFKFKGSERRDLFVRDTQTSQTVRVDALEGQEVKGAGKADVHFQTASTDGSKVFFTDTAGLTSDSLLLGTREVEGTTVGPADLYVCEVGPTISTENCPKMTDLTGPSHGFTGPGDVVGEVLGASENGTSVFFVANGAQAGGTTGNCPNPVTEQGVTAGASCNLYEAHFNGEAWEDPKLITVLSAEDAADWGYAGTRQWNLTARVSPNGRFLAFMSNVPLTGYDNRDANPAAQEARDEEVFLYDSSATAQPITCVSCNPNPAQRPTGVFDTEKAGEGTGLIVDPFSAAWTNRWLAASIPAWTALNSLESPYQARYLLDNGRLYFNSADSLVEGDTNRRMETIPGASEGESVTTEVGVPDVYQYEPQGVGSCATAGGCVSMLSSGTSDRESAFLDASASGNDVFFLTSQSLVPTDVDSVFDAYDARVCTEASPCITPPPPPAAPCSSEATCRTGGASTPSFGGASSESLGPVSIAPQVQALPSKTAVAPKRLTRAQKLSKALKRCKKKYKHAKRKRAKCEKSARHKYAAKKAKKK